MSSKTMRFSKLHGLGNDFIVVDAAEVDAAEYPQLARELCDRSFGIGADGLIFCQRSNSESAQRFSMQIFNRDGSEAEMSGNGLRCLGAYLLDQGWCRDTEIVVNTLAGSKRLNLAASNPPDYLFEVDMGPPILERNQIGCRFPQPVDSLIGCELAVGDEVYSVTITSMGNPHCSIFVDQFEDMNWQDLGRQIESHAAFPQRTNVEFIKVRSRHGIIVRFWERGVGRTLASGTGSCAAVVASVLNGYVDREVRVETEGGELDVHWKEDDHLLMRGPARVICVGEYFR